MNILSINKNLLYNYSNNNINTSPFKDNLNKTEEIPEEKNYIIKLKDTKNFTPRDLDNVKEKNNNNFKKINNKKIKQKKEEQHKIEKINKNESENSLKFLNSIEKIKQDSSNLLLESELNNNLLNKEEEKIEGKKVENLNSLTQKNKEISKIKIFTFKNLLKIHNFSNSNFLIYNKNSNKNIKKIRKNLENSMFNIITFLSDNDLKEVFYSSKKMKILFTDFFLMELNKNFLENYRKMTKGIFDLLHKNIIFKVDKTGKFIIDIILTSRINKQNLNKDKNNLYTVNLLFTFGYLSNDINDMNNNLRLFKGENEKNYEYRYKNIYKFDIDFMENSVKKLWLSKEFKKV
jgi:hypothetical protein